MLVVELWGLGDVALALPFLRAASRHAEVTLAAKPHARALLARFAPEVQLVELAAPWTAFRGKYQFLRWPWPALRRSVRALRAARPEVGVSARPDPRDHLLLWLAGARRRLGFPRAASDFWLTQALSRPGDPHRAAHWARLAEALGWSLEPLPAGVRRPVSRVIIHPGAAQPVRRWPLARFEEVASRLREAGYCVDFVDERDGSLDQLLQTLERGDVFIGNDSGPGHLAAALGRPTFTVFGPQLPERFHPQHAHAAWLPGGPCPHKPCFDACRFAAAHCLTGTSVDDAWAAIQRWLRELA